MNDQEDEADGSLHWIQCLYIMSVVGFYQLIETTNSFTKL